MKIEIAKEWSLRMARMEGDSEIGAGVFAYDPVFDNDVVPVSDAEEPSIGFGRFVQLMRRGRGLTVEALSEEVDVDIVELVEIEEDARHKPEIRTVYQLANYFHVPRSNLMQVAGLFAPKDETLLKEAVRFAARSESVEALSPAEREALEAFVVVLSKD